MTYRGFPNSFSKVECEIKNFDVVSNQETFVAFARFLCLELNGKGYDKVTFNCVAKKLFGSDTKDMVTSEGYGNKTCQFKINKRETMGKNLFIDVSGKMVIDNVQFLKFSKDFTKFVLHEVKK